MLSILVILVGDFNFYVSLLRYSVVRIPSDQPRELINFNDTFTLNLDLQHIHLQALKGAIYHYSEGEQTNLNGRRSMSARVM